jgi:hypothetical protein
MNNLQSAMAKNEYIRLLCTHIQMQQFIHNMVLFRTAGLPSVTFKDYGTLLLEYDLVNIVRATHLSVLEAK